ncbi:transcription factor protein, partial [Colletotrichum asianum]
YKFMNAASISAINIHLHVGSGCGGNAVVCTNINPNTCCGGSGLDIPPTVGFRGIPTDWKLECMGHSGGNCNTCGRSSPRATSTSSTSSPAAATALLAESDSCSTGGCANLVKPDTLLLEDGGKFDLAALEASTFLTNMKRRWVHPLSRVLLTAFTFSLTIAASGANTTGISEEFNALRIE